MASKRLLPVKSPGPLADPHCTKNLYCCGNSCSCGNTPKRFLFKMRKWSLALGIPAVAAAARRKPPIQPPAFFCGACGACASGENAGTDAPQRISFASVSAAAKAVECKQPWGVSGLSRARAAVLLGWSCLFCFFSFPSCVWKVSDRWLHFNVTPRLMTLTDSPPRWEC